MGATMCTWMCLISISRHKKRVLKKKGFQGFLTSVVAMKASCTIAATHNEKQLLQDATISWFRTTKTMVMDIEYLFISCRLGVISA